MRKTIYNIYIQVSGLSWSEPHLWKKHTKKKERERRERERKREKEKREREREEKD